MNYEPTTPDVTETLVLFVGAGCERGRDGAGYDEGDDERTSDVSDVGEDTNSPFWPYWVS